MAGMDTTWQGLGLFLKDRLDCPYYSDSKQRKGVSLSPLPQTDLVVSATPASL